VRTDAWRLVTHHAPKPTYLKRSRLTRAGAVILTWRIDAAFAELHYERGDLAAECLVDARRGIARLVEGIRDEALRRSFRGRADVQRILGT